MRYLLLSFLPLLIVSCAVIAPDAVDTAPQVSSTAEPDAVETQVVPTLEVLPEVDQTIPILIWVDAALFDNPDARDESLLKQQIDAFELANPAYSVDLRVKRATGTGGMLDSLRTTAAAAPDNLPDVVALGTRNLQLAARDGSLQSLALLSDLDLPTDIMDAVMTDVVYEETMVGIPFAGRAYISAYDSAEIQFRPVEVDDLLENQTLFVFPGADNQALTVFSMYYTAGGTVGSADDPYAIDMALLEQTLGRFEELVAAGLAPQQSIEFADPLSVWLARREFPNSLFVTDSQQVIENYDQFTNLGSTLVPTVSGRTSAALVETWHYAVVSEAPDKQLGASELLNYLLAPEQLGAWALDAGFIPLRESAANVWPEQAPVTLVRQIYFNGVAFPPTEPLQELGPVITKEVNKILASETTAADAMVEIAQELQNLQN